MRTTYFQVAPHTSDPEAPGPSIPEDGDQNADPMDHDDPDVPGPGPATLQIRLQNLPRDDSLEKENQNLPGPGPATLELRKKNLQMAAAQVEDEEMEEDVEEEEAQGAEDDVEEVACCSRPHEARYNVPNKLYAEESKCKNEARISPNSEFMGLIKSSSNGKEYCMDCFAVNQKIQNKLYMKKTNQHEKFEEVLKCTGCQKLWHRCCSLHFGSPKSFKCKFCVEKDAPMVLDAQKVRSRLVTAMEEKLNAILREKLGSKDAERNRISVRSIVSRPKKQSTKSLAPKHYSDVFESKYGKEICYQTPTIAVFEKQNGVDQVFFMLFVQEYKSTFVIDYLDSVKWQLKSRKKRWNWTMKKEPNELKMLKKSPAAPARWKLDTTSITQNAQEKTSAESHRIPTTWGSSNQEETERTIVWNAEDALYEEEESTREV